MPPENAEATAVDESRRLLALHRYRVLDTPPEEAFDRITALAARVFNVPVSLVSLVDYDRVWYKSQYGISLDATPREPGLFTSTLLAENLFVEGDAPDDAAAFSNALTAHGAGFRFYAAAPLRTRDGYDLGVLAIANWEARTLSPQEEEMLTALADIVMDQMELRLAARNAVRLHKELLNTAAHDLKNPLLSIMGFADEIEEDADDGEIGEMASIIRRSSNQMLNIINELLQLARVENGVIRLQRCEVQVAELVRAVVAENESLTRRKKQWIEVTAEEDTIAPVDPHRVREIVDNLLSNAIKYSPHERAIRVGVSGEDDWVTIEVKDDGPGLTRDEMDRLFERFSRVGAKPTGNESGTGLGLAIVKVMTELHGGRAWVESDGRGKGSTFFVRLPR